MKRKCFIEILPCSPAIPPRFGVIEVIAFFPFSKRYELNGAKILYLEFKIFTIKKDYKNKKFN